MRNTLFTTICGAILLCAALAQADRPPALSSQTIKLPSGPASLKGLGESFNADVATGSGSFSVPIELPPALLQPSLSLSYAAGRGKTALGLSWDLPVVSVYRTTDKGSPQFAETDRFAVSGPDFNDELVLVDAATGTYRVKNEGPFALFVRNRNAGADGWMVRLPNGHTLYLGETDQAREKTSRGTYRWHVERHVDKFQHEVRYSYTHDQDRRLYLSEVRYQTQAHSASGTLIPIGAAYQNLVTFEYETRPDVFSDYSYGERVATTQRLRTITVRQGARVLRTYALSYRNNLLLSLLSSVQMVGEGGLEMPALSFDYLEPTLSSGRYVEMVSRPPLEGLLNGSAQLEDVNGDSLPDLLVGTAGRYRYYENIDGVSWNPIPIAVSGSPDRNLYDIDVVLADFDGDGDRDVGHTHGNAFRYFPADTVWQGTFQGYGPPVTLNTSDTGFHFTSREVKLSDLNSDGRTDLIWQKPGQDAALINVADRLQSAYIAELPVDADFQDSRVETIDFNGDGVLDLVRKEIGWNPSRVRVWYGRGRGEYAAEQQMLNVPTGEASEFALQDVNRDGQADLVRVSGSRATYFLNDGNQRFTGARGDFYGLPAVSTTRRLMYADMNGNGSVDILWLTVDGRLTYLDLLGEPFFGMLSRIDNGMGAVTDIAYRSSTAYLVESKRAGQRWRTTLPIAVPVISEMVTRDSLDVLGFEAWESRSSYSYSDGYYDGPEREFRGFGRASLTEWGDDVGGGPSTHETLVTETHMHLGRDLQDLSDQESLKGKPYLQIQRTLAGARYATVETRWEQRWLCQEALRGVAQSILPVCNGVADRAASKDSLVSMAVSTATLKGAWEKSDAPRYTAVTQEYAPAPAPWMLAWGKPVREHDYGQVSFPGGRALGEDIELEAADVALGDDEATTETDQLFDVQQWLLGVVYEKRTLSGDGTVLDGARSFYDGPKYVGLPLGQISQGLMTRHQKWLDRENRWIDTARSEYNADGLGVSSLDAEDNLVETEYDSDTRSLTARERKYLEAGDLEFTAKYDPAYGVVTEATNFSGSTIRYVYDGLGRVIKMADPLSTLAMPTTEYIYEFGNATKPISRVTVRTLVDRDAGRYRTSHQYSDGLGRARLTKTQAEAPFGYVATDYVHLTPRGEANGAYDAFASGSADFESPPISTSVTTRRLDALGRTTETLLPDTADLSAGRKRRVYLPLETRDYDEGDTLQEFGTTTFYDGAGRPLKIVARNDQQGTVKDLVWRVKYDALGRIVRLQDPAWNDDNVASQVRSTREYHYDSLGRLFELKDPNLGIIHYSFDDLGNLVKRVDPLQQEEAWEYGLAGRLLRRTFKHDASGKADYSYEYHYDVPAPDSPMIAQSNTLGRLAWVEFPAGREHYSYDANGREVRRAAELWNPSSSFTQQVRDVFERSVALDPEGKVTSLGLPGGFTLANQYNERSLLLGMSGGPAGDVRTLFHSIAYDPRGLTVRTDAGNGTRSCADFDARGKLTGILAGRSSMVTCGDLLRHREKGFQHLRFVRTFEGNIAKIEDWTKAVSGVERLDAAYAYDHLNQLVSVKDAHGAFDFGYDGTQNLVSRLVSAGAGTTATSLPTGNFSYGEGGAGPNMMTAAGGRSYSYDAAGRLKSYNGYALDYDVEGRLTSATKEGKSVRYHYDAWGDRRLVVVQPDRGPVQVVRSVFDEYEQRDGEEVWLAAGGRTTVEMTRSKGIVVDDQLFLLEQLEDYAHGRIVQPKPLPAEYMDFDGDADFDLRDYEIARDAYASPQRERLGGERWLMRFYHHDQVGSTTHATDAVGDLVNQIGYDVHGKVLVPKGVMPVRGFAGSVLELEREVGLIRFGARYYAPDLGRWITADRHIGESPREVLSNLLESGLYSYSLNAPNQFSDPTGNDTEDDLVAQQVAEVKYLMENAVQEGMQAGQGWIDDRLRSIAGAEQGEIRLKPVEYKVKGVGKFELTFSGVGRVTVDVQGRVQFEGSLRVTLAFQTTNRAGPYGSDIRGEVQLSYAKDQRGTTASVSGSGMLRWSVESEEYALKAKAFVDVGVQLSLQSSSFEPKDTVELNAFVRGATELSAGAVSYRRSMQAQMNLHSWDVKCDFLNWISPGAGRKPVQELQ